MWFIHYKNSSSVYSSFLHFQEIISRRIKRKYCCYFLSQTWTGAVVQRWRRAARHRAYDCGGKGTNHHHTKQNRQWHIPLRGQQPPGDQQCWIYTVCIWWVLPWLVLLLWMISFTVSSYSRLSWNSKMGGLFLILIKNIQIQQRVCQPGTLTQKRNKTAQ